MFYHIILLNRSKICINFNHCRFNIIPKIIK